MNTRSPRIAVIEDNRDLREELTFFLQHKGYTVWGTDSAENFWKKLHRSPADIVLVDLGLPGEDGFSVVEYLTGLQKFGLIIITARGQQQDKIRGLNLGADLYLVKPVNFAELATAINGLWQRIQQCHDPHDTAPPRERSGEHWQLQDTEPCLITPAGEQLKLSPHEYALLNTLGRSAGEVFSRQALVNLMFEFETEPAPHRLDVILSRLRKKAKEQNISLPIRSIFGKGLVFVGTIKESSAR